MTDLEPLLSNWHAGPGSKHLRLARAISRAIAARALPAGALLPPERGLAQSLGISRTTVVSAYEVLRSQGQVISLRGSGTRVRGATQSPPPEVRSRLISTLQSMSSDAIDMAVGLPPPIDAIDPALATLSRRQQLAIMRNRVVHPLGLPELRDAIAARYASRGLPTTREQVLVTGGAQQALALLAQAFLRSGEGVLVERPTYFGALELFRRHAARVFPLPVQAGHVDPQLLRERARASGAALAYLVPTAHNPTGVTMPAGRRAQLAQVIDEAGCLLVDDETVHTFVMDGEVPAPIAAFGDSPRVFTVGSYDKLFWGGLRIGWLRAPAPVIRRVAEIKSAWDLATPPLSQALALQLDADYDRVAQARRDEMRARRAHMAALLAQHLPGWRYDMPTGGLFFWVSLPQGDGEAFAQVAAQHGVHVMPGIAYTGEPLYANHIRLTMVLPETQLSEGVRRLARAWGVYCADPARWQRAEAAGFIRS